jgi:hypothetical protein
MWAPYRGWRAIVGLCIRIGCRAPSKSSSYGGRWERAQTPRSPPRYYPGRGQRGEEFRLATTPNTRAPEALAAPYLCPVAITNLNDFRRRSVLSILCVWPTVPEWYAQQNPSRSERAAQRSAIGGTTRRRHGCKQSLRPFKQAGLRMFHVKQLARSHRDPLCLQETAPPQTRARTVLSRSDDAVEEEHLTPWQRRL